VRKCEIAGCYEKPIEKAHIRSKGGGATTGKHNIINLCVGHHRLYPDSFHSIGVWSFAKKFGFEERFKQAYAIEAELEQARRKDTIGKWQSRKKKGKRICPHCKRSWSKGILLIPKEARAIQI